jgi:hypothetical protein
MARGRKVTVEVRDLIIRVHERDRKVKAKKVREAVEGTLRGSKDYEKLRPIPQGWPSLSTVQKVLADFHQREGKLSAQDKEQEEPWDMSTLGKHPIPSEVVPVVLDVSMQSQHPLTIREAKWIGRLYSLLSMVLSQQGIDKALIAFIEGMAVYYATSERIGELMGERVSPTMDRVLWEFLTKRESIAEITKRAFNPSDFCDNLTKEQLNHGEAIRRKLRRPRPFRESIEDTLGISLEVKEDKNERTSEQRQSKKA